MKRFFNYFLTFFTIFCTFFSSGIFLKCPQKTLATSTKKPKLAIVIDDFGSYDESGVSELLNLKIPLTCAVLPNTDNTSKHLSLLNDTPFEIILHMPMESHVNLPKDWYGPVYISNTDTTEKASQKLEQCLNQMPKVKGFNIHIGSGVSQNEKLMATIYEFAKENNLYFLDSRTIETKVTENACKNTNSIYLGRDVFLEADKNRSYAGVKFRINEAVETAKEEGYAIAIGHVGAEGGINTAKAITDMLPEIKKAGVEIVPLSKIYNELKQK